VVKGRALVRVGEDRRFLHEKETVTVGRGQWHQLINPEDVPLEILEVQSGAKCVEEDIERFSIVFLERN
jgi:mannose-6-phosphate isomerase-like protein (cupin superfamily)